MVNDSGGYFDYVVPLFAPDQMKQSHGDLLVTCTTGRAKC
jgi:hypothetical protein